MRAITLNAVCFCACVSTSTASAQSYYLTDQATFTSGLAVFTLEDFNAGPVDVLPDGTLAFEAFSVSSNALAGASIVNDRLSVAGASNDDVSATAFINFDQPVTAIGMNLFEASVMIFAEEEVYVFDSIADFAGAEPGDFGVIEFSEPVTRLRLVPALGFSMNFRIDNLVIALENSPCTADANNDGTLSPADFSAWIAAFNAGSPECDQNADGLCTPADFSAWIANFNAGC